MWEEITSSDIEQAKHTLNLRRAEMFSRHAQEIGEIDADQSELEQLRQTLAAFASKYNLGNGEAATPVATPSDEEVTATSEGKSKQPAQSSDQPGAADVARSVNFNFNRVATA